MKKVIHSKTIFFFFLEVEIFFSPFICSVSGEKKKDFYFLSLQTELCFKQDRRLDDHFILRLFCRVHLDEICEQEAIICLLASSP